MKKLTTILIISFFFSAAVFGQKIKVLKGDVTTFKGKDVVNIEYDYSNMSVGKFKNEEDYVAKKVKEYNEDEPGRGDKWAQAWVDDRGNRFEPKFEELFNKYASGKTGGVALEKFGDNEYTLTFKTTFTEPGFNIGVMKKPASINGELILTDSDGKELVKMGAYGCPGSQFGGFDFDSGTRIAESYAKCAKSLASYIVKKGLK